MNGGHPALLPLVALCLLIFSAPPSVTLPGYQSANQGNIRVSGYPSTSWALGVVLPEGAGLAGGGSLGWESVTNLTCEARLPFVPNPDGIVYAVMSVMAGDGSVMQVAAGIYPNSSLWRAYSWYVEGVLSSNPTYRWVLNASAPPMSPGDRILLSIYRSSGLWELSLTDATSGGVVNGSFPPGIQSSLKAGEQEVFALESYSRTAEDFARMGNLTLDGVYANDQRVVSGFYSYGGWDPSHDPVFVVGSSGTSPPIFVSLNQESGGTYDWSYSDAWSGYVTPSPVGVWAVVVVAAIAITVASVWASSRSPKAKNSSPGSGR